jgi:hypothetical protein
MATYGWAARPATSLCGESSSAVTQNDGSKVIPTDKPSG